MFIFQGEVLHIPLKRTDFSWACGGLFQKISENGSNILVGGFNPFEKYSSNWIISPSRGEHKKCLKSPPSICFIDFIGLRF